MAGKAADHASGTPPCEALLQLRIRDPNPLGGLFDVRLLVRCIEPADESSGFVIGRREELATLLRNCAPNNPAMTPRIG
jgi:hypothetical protein